MLLITNSKGHFPKGKVRIGWYDSELVCLACEGGFGTYDDYAVKLLLQQERTHRPLIIKGELKGWEIPVFDFNKLTLFMASILWRAGASSLPQFKKIKLKKSNLNNIKNMILNGNVNDGISFILARFPDKAGQSFIVDPHPETLKDIFGNLGVYRFYLGGGYIAYIKVGNKPFPSPSDLMAVSIDQPLRILCRTDFLLSREFTSMQKVATDANETLIQIKNTGK